MGVPPIIPVVELRVRPPGRLLPDLRENVYGAIPPVTLSWVLYTEDLYPSVRFAVDSHVNVGKALIVMVMDFAATIPFLSVACML